MKYFLGEGKGPLDKPVSFGSVAPRSSGFLRHVLELISWTIVAQGVSLASMLVLPRLFHPEQFGVFSVFSGFVVMFGIVGAGRYEYAIGLPGSDADAVAVFTLCIGLATLAFIVCLLASIALPIGAISPKLSVLDPWWTLVAVGVACIGWYNAATYMALRVGRFGAVGRSKVLTNVVTAVGQVAAGLFVSHGDGALIVPLLAGQLVGTLFLVWVLSEKKVPWTFDCAALVSVAGRYIRFPKYFAPGSLLDGIGLLLPAAAIMVLYSPAQAGIYALADRALRAPCTLVGSSVLQVFYQRSAELRGNPGACRNLLLRIWFWLAAVALPPCIALAAFGEDIFAALFGSNWRDSGRVAETMAFALFFFFVSYSTSNILIVNERARRFLLLQTAQVVMVGAALWIASRGALPSLGVTVGWVVSAQTSVYLLSMALQLHAVGTDRGQLAVGTASCSGGGQ